MDAVINIFNIGNREEMLQPVGGVIPRKFDFAGFDAVDNTHMQAVVANDLLMFFDPVDLVGCNHGEALGTLL
jgi:hypothetical protein